MTSSDKENKRPARPRQVTYAVYLIYAAIALGFLFAITFAAANWQASVNRYTDPIELICFGFGYLISIYIAMMIAGGRSWARFLLAIDFIIAFLNGAAVLEFYIDYPLPAALFVLSTFLRLTAIILLFQSASNIWFKAMKEHLKPEHDLPEESAAEAEDQPTPEEPFPNGSFEAEAQEVSTAVNVAYAAAAGAALGIINALFWALTLPPQSDSERQLILFLVASGLALGAVTGALIGFLFLRIARQSPSRDPQRWAVFGGLIGGMLSFGCGFLTMMLSLA